MTAFIVQYKLLFSLSWVLLYLIFPTWALPISVAARALVFCGLIIYFLISAAIMNRWFNALDIDKPLIVQNTSWGTHFKNNLWLVIICFVAVVLHAYPISFPILILGDEAIHLHNGLWIYEHIDVSRHSFFQVAFWIIIGLLIIIRKKISSDNFVLNKLYDRLFGPTKDNLLKYSFAFFIIVFFVAYFLLLQNITFLPSLIRYPPVSKFLYFGAYSAFGINHIFPRIVQLCFYLLCSIYLYRTINLFYEKEAALFGATMYLFLPISFTYAHLGELASGTIFFMVAISFYFLRFIKEGDERDLLIATYLIGIGCLYKKLHMIMFIVCFAFFIVYKMKKKNFPSLIHFKVLSISLVPIIPWMILTRNYSWRNYLFQSSNLTALNTKIIPYFSLISSNLSEIIFALLVVSVFYIWFFRRNILTVYFSLLFAVYFFFIISDMGSLSPRFSMVFYPTIIVFLSLFISRLIQYIKWRHAYKFCTVLLAIYLIIICTVPPLNNRFLAITNMKLHYYPSKMAMKWVKDNVKDGEKIMTIRILSSMFYKLKYGIAQDKIIDLPYGLRKIFTPDKLKALYKKHNLDYIMFPYSPTYIENDVNAGILQYLKDNSNEEFVEISKYNLDDNFIYIYKMKND